MTSEISNIVLHLIRFKKEYNEHFLPKRSGLDPDSLESCTRDYHYRTMLEWKRIWVDYEYRYIEMPSGKGVRQHVRDARIHSSEGSL